MTSESSKYQIREDVRAALSTLDSAEYEEKSQQICTRLKEMSLWADVSTVHVFIPSLERREPDIRPFILHLMSEGKTIVLPVVKIYSRELTSEPRLQHRVVTSIDDLVVNRWGISEPAKGHAPDAGSIDVVIVPAVGADRNGNRLGNGFGYYDEFLAEEDSTRICPILNIACLECIPAEPHDIGMTYIVTESETMDFSGT